MKNILLSLAALTAFALAVPAHAASFPLNVSLSSPNQSGAAGDTLDFYGVITNETNTPVSLGGLAFTFDLPANLTVDTDPFFANTPDPLNGLNDTGLIELFEITLSAPFTGTDGATLDVVTDDGSTVVGETTFSVAETQAVVASTPEPSSLILLLTGLPAALPLVRRRRR